MGLTQAGTPTPERATINRRAQVDKPAKAGWIRRQIILATFRWLISMSATINRRADTERRYHNAQCTNWRERQPTSACHPALRSG